MKTGVREALRELDRETAKRSNARRLNEMKNLRYWQGWIEQEMVNRRERERSC